MVKPSVNIASKTDAKYDHPKYIGFINQLLLEFEAKFNWRLN